jgi:hypothetical protein
MMIFVFTCTGWNFFYILFITIPKQTYGRKTKAKIIIINNVMIREKTLKNSFKGTQE